MIEFWLSTFRLYKPLEWLSLFRTLNSLLVTILISKAPVDLPVGEENVKHEGWSDAIWMASLPLLKKHLKKIIINYDFCLDFPLKMRIFALLSEGSPVWHEHCSNTTQTLHRHDTNISALLQYFCIDFAAFALRLNPNESTNSHKFSQKYFLLLTLEISFCLTY